MPKLKFTAKFIESVNSDKQIEYFDLHTSGLGLRVSPGGTKTFFYRYRSNGKNRRYTINRFSKTFSLADARVRVDELRSYTRKGGDPYYDEKAAKNDVKTTLKEAIDAYKNKHIPTLKKSTQIDYKRRIKHLLMGEGERSITKNRGFDGDRFIEDIRRPEVIDYLNEIAKNSPTQAKRLQAILSGLFKFSKDREWVDVNVASEITIKYRRKNIKKKWHNRAFNDAEIKTLWSAFDNHNEPIGSLFKILTILGQRSGETRLMKWDDVNLKSKYWEIPATDTKNGLSNFVPLPDMASEIITGLREKNSESIYVFSSPVIEKKPVYGLQKAANRISKETTVSDFNAHSLRTTVATRLATLGISSQVLSKILNHKSGEENSITALYNRYDYKEEKRSALVLWGEQLGEIINESNVKSAPSK